MVRKREKIKELERKMGDFKVKKEVVVDKRYCYEEEIEYTVHKTSMFSKGDGFSVYDSNGDIIFRVHSYGSIKHPVLLMDRFGKPLLTLIPKRPTLHQMWEGFKGEKLDHHDQQPHIFSIWKSSMIRRSSITVQVHDNNRSMYQIEGSFTERSCTIFHTSSSSSSSDDHHGNSKESRAQIKRKVDPTRKVALGRDVFSLTIKAGFDAAFAMGLVLALDRIVGDEDDYAKSSIIELH